VKHPVQIFAIAIVCSMCGAVSVRYPQILIPVLACCVLAAAMLACSCAFAGRRRNIDDKP
jgi:hypothetical protein